MLDQKGAKTRTMTNNEAHAKLSAISNPGYVVDVMIDSCDGGMVAGDGAAFAGWTLEQVLSVVECGAQAAGQTWRVTAEDRETGECRHATFAPGTGWV